MLPSVGGASNERRRVPRRRLRWHRPDAPAMKARDAMAGALGHDGFCVHIAHTSVLDGPVASGSRRAKKARNSVNSATARTLLGRRTTSGSRSPRRPSGGSMKASLLGATFALLGIVACSAGTSTSSGGPGTSSGTTSGGNGSSSGTTTNSSTFECCINSAFYKCPDQATLDRCGNFQSPDPSGCTRQAKACGSSSSSSSSGTSTNPGGNKSPAKPATLRLSARPSPACAPTVRWWSPATA